MELECQGLAVRRKPIGSDFEVESDFVEDENEVGLELSGHGRTTLIEVKSTRMHQVKMTPVQAEHACSRGESYALCVVPLDDNEPTRETIRERLKVVANIGAYLGPALSDYKSMCEAADAARKPQGAVELVINEGEARFLIHSEIWEDARSFDAAIDYFRRP